METKNEELRKEHSNSPSAPQIDIPAALASVQTFINFCENYLNTNRPAELFYPEANYGIRLTNGAACVISPPVTVERGSMQPSTYAPVTGVRYAQELETGNAHPILRPQTKLPKGVTDASLPTAAVDRTQSAPGKRYDN